MPKTTHHSHSIVFGSGNVSKQGDEGEEKKEGVEGKLVLCLGLGLAATLCGSTFVFSHQLLLSGH